MAAPPLAAGVNDTCSEPAAGDTALITGADGVAAAMPVATAEAWPGPTLFTARSSTWYGGPISKGVVPSLDRVEMTSGLAVVPAARVRQVAPASVEYW